jgi:hypothetical protein
MLYTRREMGKLALAGLPAAVVASRSELLSGWAQAKPNSLIAGVQIGVIAPYSFGQDANTAEQILS